ncbi:MAG: DNA polymerase/3'-5' exonuclease PolX [Cyclobacteriaceae bacterium]
MPVHNKEIARMLNEIADLLDIKGENEFRIRSYRTAARTISGLTENIAQMADNKKDIESIPGIGESMAEKIEEIARTGSISQLDELREQIPASLVEIMKLEQMGPQRTKILNEELNIESIDDLKKAAKKGEIEKLEGFGEKTTENILREIEEYSEKGGSKRTKLHEASEMIKPLLDYLGKKVDDVTIAGSYRRQKETVGDIDILGISNDPDKAMDHFVNFEEVERVIAKGESKSSVKLRTDLQVDLRIFDKKSFGAAILYFTGSKAHNIALRKIGQGKDYKINEYGVYKGNKRVAGKTEKEIYEKLGLIFIEPELREDRGEIEAAKKDQLPDLITLDDIKGDLQTHTNATDGKYSLEEMVKAAEEMGYEYYAVTDHSKKVSMAKGLDEKRLASQIEEIDEINRKMKKIRILKAVEVDILEDGSLDLSDDILKELDLVVCAIHYNMNLSKKKQTTRILKAMENPYTNILAHPTGRKIAERNGYDLDMEKIMKEARNQGFFLEINSNPDRLDLNDKYIKQAKEIGLKLAISTDAHSIDNLEYMKYGVAQARRGWLEKGDVINTRSWKDLKKLLKRN